MVVPSIYTRSIEAKLSQIKRFGGKKLKGKTSIGKKAQQGCFALVEDLDGNKMRLYSRK